MPVPVFVGAARAALLLCAAVFFVGCAQAPSSSGEPACVPVCSADHVCGDDGCGGSCGDCAQGEACSPDGQCGADCDSSCDELGLSCGDHCGTSCGTCEAGEACVEGACECLPACSASTCEEADGCGGTCGPCTDEVGCTTCAMALSIHEKRTNEVGDLTGVVVAVTWKPLPGFAGPTLADIRLLVEGPGEVVRLGVGAPVLEAGKRLVADPRTARPWQLVGDGSAQALIAPDSGAGPIAAGTSLYFDVEIGEPDGSIPVEPVRLSLVAREGTLAPGKADEALWGSAVDDPLVLWAR